MKLAKGQRWLRRWGDRIPPSYKIVEITDAATNTFYNVVIVSTDDPIWNPIGLIISLGGFPEDNDESNYKNNIWKYLKGQDKPSEPSI